MKINRFGSLLAFVLAGCNSSGAQTPPPAGPAEVGVVTLAAAPVTLSDELPGRTAAYRVAEVRARVNGIVQQRTFVEGSDIKEGAPLFRIDPAPYQAALASARASLARAQANLATAKILSERYTELLDGNAVSKQEFDDAVAKRKAAEADVAAGRAAVQAAAINLGYTNVTSPIPGKIGRSDVTEGAYVQQGQATLLATVQQLDPIYVDLSQSSTEALRLRRAIESGSLQADGASKAKVKLILEDGTEYAQEGTLQMSDATVDPATGSITLRALFPNPKQELLPGMFVRAKIDEGVDPDGILVPQSGVTRNAMGKATALVVGKDGKAEVRLIQADRAIGDKWLVTDGLGAGDQVIVEGLQKVRPGAPVHAVPAANAVAQAQ